MQPRPNQLQMMVELCASSVSVSTLNAMLMKAQIMCKGLKVQKAKCLVEKLPVHKLQKLLAEAMNPPADPEATDTRSSTAAGLAADSDARADDAPVPEEPHTVTEIAAKATDPSVDAATPSAFCSSKHCGCGGGDFGEGTREGLEVRATAATHREGRPQIHRNHTRLQGG